jgi:uncharacterized membrane protein YcaP (DUF421 family)
MEGLITRWFAVVFTHPDLMGALAIAGKTAVIYVFLIAGLRLLGKRELGQMSIYDLVLIVVIANAVQNAMVGDDNTLGGGMVAALTLLLMNRAITWLMLKQPGFREWMVGAPVLIVRDGKPLQDVMRRERLTREHLLAAMREHGIGDLEDVQMAVLEVDGAISIVSKEASVHRTRKRFRGLRAEA